MESTEETLQRVFYNVRQGFGNQLETLRKAREINPLITLSDVRAFLRKQTLRQDKRRDIRYNSWVPKAPRQEFQIDLMDWGAGVSPRYGMVAVDIFTKRATIVPLPTKSAEATSAALPRIFRELGMPAQIMVDLGSEFQSAFASRAKKFFDIPLLVTRNSPHFVERVIGTFRNMFRDRMRAFRLPWQRVIQPVLEKYNETVHTATKVSPDAAAREDRDVTHQLQDRFQSKQKLQYKYPPLEEGDRVRIRIKPGKYGEFKGGFQTWSERVYPMAEKTLVGDQQAYKLEGWPTAVLRHDLLKVADAQQPPAEIVQAEQSRYAPPRRLTGKTPDPRVQRLEL